MPRGSSWTPGGQAAAGGGRWLCSFCGGQN
jgi:hypothetical protein